ncbi:LysM peptidoglycan-binding domain-containing protein [Propionivibrio sp.]|uniref:lytic transglycosylase n=1 Tax=Propionivibrio sp. TaxID=2212460 RepID=UPI0025E1E244|nr:LysM peptidoglycan-binding domain-containing protein [Propionivibrio sp.]MBK8744558.1 LysM peptidoglycan-binding domain-containing protein [Propionivibrio sp.]MBL0208300.1 LysM peptidoglycan-binding domain-containing protein [Propionivibrio sp.]
MLAIARFAWLLLLLSGCATVIQDPDQSSTPSSATATNNQRTQAADAGSTPSKPRAKGKSSAPLPADGSLPTIEISAPHPAPKAIDLTSESEELFQRMRNGFSMPDINNDLVLYHQQWYMNRPDYLRRMVERSTLYMHFIVEELEKRGMPMELALLPMVESAYNPMAYSRAKASGLWQFIPSTGKRYKLDQSWWKDERRDIVASTTAALDYLQSIYEMHGDWHLALASYNWGEGAVGRAIEKNRMLGLPTDYLSLTMPEETKNYVPKLQALKNIFSSPLLVADLHLPKIPNRPYFGTVTRSGNIDVKLAARLAEMPVKDFVALNPSHNRPVIKSDTPLVIPADKMDTFVSNLEAQESSNKPLSSWQAYTVRPGDKLEKIAPRFGMTVANLKEANGIKGRIKVNPGLTLLVAGQNGGEPLSMDALPEQPRLPEASTAPVAATRTHIVRKGETLLSIARHYTINAAELKRINRLRSNNIAVGTRLTLTPERTVVAKSGAKPGKEKGTNSPQASTRTPPKVTRYTVRRGDTLHSIAKHFKVSTDDLQRWNRVSARALKPGQTLTIQLARNP